VVEQSLQHGASAAQVAREHDINGNLWRWHYRSSLLGPSSADGTTALIPVELTSATSGDLTPYGTERLLSIRCGELHITLPSDVDPVTLKTVLASLPARCDPHLVSRRYHRYAPRL
jgi:hypothetical protein